MEPNAMEPNAMVLPVLPSSPADLVPLPTCEGPKLHPFDFRGEEQDIEFLFRLDSSDLDDGHPALVFVVKIRGETYVLKVELIPGAVQHDYYDMFNNECRAYGRLKEANREDLAAKCHGYILLTQKMEQRLLDFVRWPANHGPFWDVMGDARPDWARKQGVKFLPVRAIVKDFVDGDWGFKIPNAPRILQDIVELQRLGILVGDVAERQWMDGQFIDFDRATTTPHVLLNPEVFGYDLTDSLRKNWHCSPEELVLALARRDFEEFDQMAEEWPEEWPTTQEGREGKITLRCLPDSGRLERLRPKSVRLYTYVDPREYDWRTRPFGKGRAVKTARACCGKSKRVPKPKALIRVGRKIEWPEGHLI